MAMNLDQVLNSIEDNKAINEIRNSLETHLSHQGHHHQQQSASINLQPRLQHLQNHSYEGPPEGGGRVGPNNGQFYGPATPTSNDPLALSSTSKPPQYLNGSSSMQTADHLNTNYNNNINNSSNNNNSIHHHNHNNNSKSSYVLNPPHGGARGSFSSVGATTTTNMPTNEPVKLVYPVSGTATATSGGIVTSATQLPNGINLNQLSQQPQQQQTTIIGGNLVKGGTSGQTLIIKNPQGSSAPGMVTVTKTLNNQAPNIVGHTPTMLQAGNIQIVNVRPGAPTTATANTGAPQNHQQKTVAAVPPRVVISSGPTQIVRPANSTQIALANMQGQAGQTILFKTENGQYQLLRIAPQQGGQTTTIPVSGAGVVNTGGNQTIRLQTVPAQQAMSAGTIIVSTAGSMPPMSSVPSGNTIVAASHHQQPQPHIVNSSGVTVVAPQQPQHVVNATTATPNRTSVDNSKEKCRKFLTNLIELSKREPKSVERNVRTLIQELVDANVEPEEFCERLERLLNASPQPCLIGFLKKSLPLLRQSLVTKEIVIEGINAPSPSVAFSGTTITTASIPAQIRPVGNIGQTQIRMITTPTAAAGNSPLAVPKIGQTTIRQTTPIRIQTTVPGHPRLPTQIRPGSGTTIVQQPATVGIQSTPPALQPVSGLTTQIRGALSTTTLPTRPQVQIARTTVTSNNATVVRTTPQSAAKIAAAPSVVRVQQQSTTTLKLTSAKQQQDSGSGGISLTTITNHNSSLTSSSGGGTTIMNNHHPVVLNNKITTKSQQSHGLTALQTVVPKSTSASSSSSSFPKEKERKASSSAYATASSYMYGDDDINDVAAMGGVNLAEESQRILGQTDFVGTQIRSCKDEVFLNLPLLQHKIRSIVAKHGLEEPNSEVAVLISHATQERLKNIVEKLAVIAEHRIDIIKVDPRYEVTKDVRGQIKFLEELDKAEQKRHEEQEREMLMRAAKSRSKTEDPEQVKLKQKAKEMRNAELEEIRQKEANLTALQAIGPRKKPRLDGDANNSSMAGTSALGMLNKGTTPLRPRIKRVNMRDMLFFLEHEKDSCRSSMLYKSYLK